MPQPSRAPHHSLAEQVVPSAPTAPHLIRQLQRQLQQAGYEVGPIDGILGPRTLAALQQYMADQARSQVAGEAAHSAPSADRQG